MWNTLRQRNFSLLWFGGLISMMGDWALGIGLPIYVYQLTNSALATSFAVICNVLPRLVLGPLAGVFVDRWDRRRTMIVTNLLLAIGLVPLLWVRGAQDVWVVYVVLFFQTCLSVFFDPAENALLPLLVGEEHLVAANSLNELNNSLARLIGPALGGFAAAATGLLGITLIDMASFLISAVMIALITGSYRVAAAEHAHQGSPLQRIWSELRDGVRVVRRSRPVSVIFLLMTITSVGEGVFAVLFLVFVNRVLGGGAQQIGWFMSAQAIGGLLGGLFVARLARRVAPSTLIGIGAMAFGAIDLAIFNYPRLLPGIVPGLLLFVLVGIPGVCSRTGIMTMLQTNVPDAFRGRVFAALQTLTTVAVLVGTLTAGMLGDRFGVVSVLNVQGLGYIIAGFGALVLLRAAVAHASAHTPQQALSDGL